jgi:hypothetical protein
MMVELPWAENVTYLGSRLLPKRSRKLERSPPAVSSFLQASTAREGEVFKRK